MTKTLALVLCSLALVSGTAHADLMLPQASPGARVGATVGLTDIDIEYSSPSVKGRKIFGAVVPFGTVWRTGANRATKITFSKDVIIGDKPVAAGVYGLYSIPGAASWTLIINKGAMQSGLAYKQTEDVVRVDVKPKVAPMRERMAFIFSDVSNEGVSLDLEWDKTRVSLPIKTKTDDQVQAGIKNMTENAWRPYANAAKYLLDSKKNTDQGLDLVEKSLAIKEDWFNVWVKASLLAQKGKYKDAYPLAEKAQQLGQAQPDGFFGAPDIKKALVDWKGKS